MAGRNEDLEIVIGADLSGLAADLNKSKFMVQQFSRDVNAATPKASDFRLSIDVKGLQRVSKEARDAGGSIRSLGGDLLGFAGKAAIAAGAFVAVEAGLKGVGSAFEYVKSSVVKAAEFEQLSISFETMLGSADRAGRTLADLRKFAAETPFSSKDVNDGARSLLAYGVAADQLIPTLKLLGSVSAAYNTPLKDEVLRYGTVKVQGVMHQQDVNQYVGQGIDINPGLAKSLAIDATQIRKFTEDSRVQFKNLQESLIDLERTRFPGILEKQAKSLKGGFEQLGDAWDVVKLKLGQVVVKESGLKDILKNGETFAKSVERALDSEGFRRGVRFTSDLVKAGGQLTYEFSRAGAAIAGIGFESIGRSFPQIERVMKSVHVLLKDAQDFKFDDDKLADFALNVAEEFVIGAAKMTDAAVEFGGKFNKSVIEPLGKAIQRVDALNKLADNPWALVAFPTTVALKMAGLIDAPAGDGKPVVQAVPEIMPLAKGGDKAIVQQWHQIKRDRDIAFAEMRKREAEKNWLEDTGALEKPNMLPARNTRVIAEFNTWKAKFDSGQVDIQRFLRNFKGDEEVAKVKLLDAGTVPERPDRKYEDIARDNFEPFKVEVKQRVQQNKIDRATARLGEFRTQALMPMGGMAALGPY